MTFRTAEESRSAGGVSSVRAALRIVDTLAAAGTPLGVVELARRVGRAPSSVHRLLATLIDAGYVAQDDRRRYHAAPAIARLAARASAPPELRSVAHPVLERLAEASGEAVHLAVLDRVDVVGVDHVVGARPGHAAHVVGSRIPAHATAVGLALLAHRPDVADAVVRAGLVPWTASTVSDEAGFRAGLARVRRRGYAINLRGWHEDTAGVAAAILLADGRAVAAVGISGPADRLDRRSAVFELGRLARSAADEIAARIDAGVPEHPRPDARSSRA